MANIEFIIALVILSFLTYVAMRTPSHDRVWSKDQEVLPSVSTYGEHITVHNVRQARYRSVDDYDVEYANWTFSLSDIKGVWLLIEPFGNFSIFGLKPAHVLLSFELKNGNFLSVSPEIRKKKGDVFSPIKSFFRSYEIMYVLADEQDVVALRTNHRKDDVRLYPLALPKKRVQQLFQNITHKVNDINAKAAFFNTAVHSCVTNVVTHLRDVNIPLPRYHLLYLLPGTLDGLLFKNKLIATKLPLEKARSFFYVTDKAQACGDAPDFSQKIRLSQQKSA